MKLVIYGDSFVNHNNYLDIQNKQYCWPEKVAKNLGLNYINNAVSGSSAEYSMYKFVKDIENERIDSDDLVIYVQTNGNRLYSSHFIHKEPNMSCSFTGLSKKEIKLGPRYYYFRENYDHLVWHYNSIEPKVNSLHHESFLHSIKNYAVNNPGVKILLLLLESMPEFGEMDHFGFLKNLPKNLYFPNLSLNSISRDEFVDDWNVGKWSRLIGYDPRLNHFSRPNLKTLVNLTTDTFKNGGVKDWTKDKFITKIFSRADTLEEYLDYCNRKLLWCYPNIVEAYKKFR